MRKTADYFRFDTPEEQAALVQVYSVLCPLYNYFMPSFKLFAKEKQADGQYKKIYEKAPKTPYQRLLNSLDVSEECKAELRWRKRLYNPVILNTLLNKAVEHLLHISAEKGQTENIPLSEDKQASAA